MIISRTIAKGRIAREERPTWVAAWGLVGLDFLLFVVFAAIAGRVWINWIMVSEPNMALTYGSAFFVFFVPLQAVMIVSSLWASKSRWTEMDTMQ